MRDNDSDHWQCLPGSARLSSTSTCSPDCPCAAVSLGFSLDILLSNDQAVVESAAFYSQITRPLMYAAHNLPLWLVNEFSGKSKFANRCARAGLAKLITVSEGHGGFLLRPNPGQLDPATRCVMKQVYGKDTAELWDAAQQQKDGEQDPLGLTIDVKTRGYNIGAWWVPPELLPQIEILLRKVEAEGQRLAMAARDDLPASSLTSLPPAVPALGARQPSEYPVLEEMVTE
jgi:hypothetical protein